VSGAFHDRIEKMLAELPLRNADNVSRTESYLELYALTRAHPPDLPWLLMAHMVSRHAGYLMSDIAASLDGRGKGPLRALSHDLFLFLERANFLIFHDAWYHVASHLAGRKGALLPGRTTRFIRDAWRRYEEAVTGPEVPRALERALVMDLVYNEQQYIEHRVVHAPRFREARVMIALTEWMGRDPRISLPPPAPVIRVGGFAQLGRRLEAGRRLYDEVLADRGRRAEIYEWARSHPHTGSRAVWGGRPGPALRDAWPVAQVRALWSGIHAPPELDPHWPALTVEDVARPHVEEARGRQLDLH
jgi:hypothetical protein